MPHEEIITINRDPRTGELTQVRREDGSTLLVVETLESWTNPEYGKTAGATPEVIQAFRIMVSDSLDGRPYEATIRQYGGSRPGSWHLRRVAPPFDIEALRAVMRAAMVARVREILRGKWSHRSRAATIKNLVLINKDEGFALPVAGAMLHSVQFAPDEFEKIIAEVVAEEKPAEEPHPTTDGQAHPESTWTNRAGTV